MRANSGAAGHQRPEGGGDDRIDAVLRHRLHDRPADPGLVKLAGVTADEGRVTVTRSSGSPPSGVPVLTGDPPGGVAALSGRCALEGVLTGSATTVHRFGVLARFFTTPV